MNPSKYHSSYVPPHLRDVPDDLYSKLLQKDQDQKMDAADKTSVQKIKEWSQNQSPFMQPGMSEYRPPLVFVEHFATFLRKASDHDIATLIKHKPIEFRETLVGYAEQQAEVEERFAKLQLKNERLEIKLSKLAIENKKLVAQQQKFLRNNEAVEKASKVEDSTTLLEAKNCSFEVSVKFQKNELERLEAFNKLLGQYLSRPDTMEEYEKSQLKDADAEEEGNNAAWDHSPVLPTPAETGSIISYTEDEPKPEP